MRVEEVRPERHHRELRGIRERGAAEHVPDLAAEIRGEVDPPGYLHRVKGELSREWRDLIRAFGGKHAHDRRVRGDRGADRLPLFEGEAARALREDQADEIRSGFEGYARVLRARDAADLDPCSHRSASPLAVPSAPRSARSASPGDSERRRLSPISTASAPARSRASSSARSR